MRPGTMVGDFTVHRTLSRDPQGMVCEATQAGLERTVVLRILSSAAADPAAAVRLSNALARLAALDHPALPGLLVAGDSEHGPYAAFRMPPGRELTDPGLDRRLRADALRQLSEALDSLHAQHLAHGALGVDAVRMDESGNAVLLHAGTAIGDEARSIADDRAAYARLERDLATLDAQRLGKRVRWSLAAAVMLAIGAGAVLLVGGDAEREDTVPPLEPGMVAIGSDLGPADRTVGCDGQPPTLQSAACTLVQSRLPGYTVEIPRGGVIRAWAVRGAAGELALQVIRRRERGWRSVRESQLESVPDSGIHRFESDLPVDPGDRVALEVPLGSGVGMADREGAGTLRWPGTALGWEPMAPDSASVPELAGELLLRVELAPGERRREPTLVSGRELAGVSDGEAVGERAMPLSEGGTRIVRVVRLDREVAVDIFRGLRRVARIAVPEADPGGSLERLEDRDRADAVALEWTNPDGELIRHSYVVRANSVVFVD